MGGCTGGASGGCEDTPDRGGVIMAALDSSPSDWTRTSFKIVHISVPTSMDSPDALPSGSDTKDELEGLLVPGVRITLVTSEVGRALAEPAPLIRDPLEGGVMGRLLWSLPDAPGGGDLDLFRGPEDPSAPIACEAVRVELSDCIATSAMLKGDARNSGPSSASWICGTSSTSSGPATVAGKASASSVSADATPKRAVASVF